LFSAQQRSSRNSKKSLQFLSPILALIYRGQNSIQPIAALEKKHVCHAEIEGPMGASGPEDFETGFKNRVASALLEV
jgi:hypothetical protein